MSWWGMRRRGWGGIGEGGVDGVDGLGELVGLHRVCLCLH